jgi:hypothetical protein
MGRANRSRAWSIRLPASSYEEQWDRKGGPGKLWRFLTERPALAAASWVAVMTLFALPDAINGSWLGLTVRALIVAVGVPLFFVAARKNRKMWEDWEASRQGSGQRPGDEPGAV